MKSSLLYLSALILNIHIHLSAQQKGATPLASLTTKPSGSSYALVVGISDYQDSKIPDLRFADKDAEAFANFLRSPAGGSLDEDHLKVLINNKATGAQIGMALDWLIEVSKENNQVIIYFSGHGDVESKRISTPGYLLGWDAPSRVYMTGGTVNVRDLQDIISTLSVQNKARVVLITDACHSGKLSGNEINGAQLTGQNLARQFANEVKILSCQPNEYSIEGEQWGGGRGAFSYHLVNSLYGLADVNKDLSVSLKEVSRYLDDHVTTEVAPVNQNPQIVGNPGEVLARVDAKLLAAWRDGKSNPLAMISPVETRGMEEEVLAGVDTATREVYQLFKKALKDKIFLEPLTACADVYYERLIAEPKLSRLHSTLKRNYAAALQDDAQQVLNTSLNTGLTSEVLTGKTPDKIYKNYPANLERAAQLLGKDHYMYSILQARKYYFEGIISLKKEERKQSLFKALQWQSNMPHAFNDLILTYSTSQKDSAEYYAAKALELVPSWVMPYCYLYFFYRAYKMDDQAEKALDKAYNLDSNSLFVWYQIASYYYNIKDYKKAEYWYLKTIKGSGEDICFPCAHNSLGNIYKKTFRYTEAEQQYKKAIQLDSNIVITYNGLGNLYSENQKRYIEAEQQYKKAIQLDSNYVYAYYSLGNVYLITNRLSEAEQQYKKAIQLDSNLVYAINNLGMVYVNANRLSEAEHLFKKAIQLDSNLVNGYYNLVWLYGIQNKKEEAYLLLEKAIVKGYNEFEHMQVDADLASLREDKQRWKALMNKYFPEKMKD